MPFDEHNPRRLEGEGDRWEGKPISKEALIACVQTATYLGSDVEKLVTEIENKNFAGCTISVPDAGTKEEITAQVTDEPMPQIYDRYCGDSVKAALEAVLDEETLAKFPNLNFPSTIRLK